ncbi:MAG TPA: VOC family protein [Thermohalobaculum sp.]|nr:VOC family protein [Thermohalobaculum sp.]
MADRGDRGFKVRALGEIAIRCADIAAMERFYQEVIGLEKLADRAGGITFFRIAEGHAGHTAVLALFAHDATVRPGLHPTDAVPEAGARSSLHHLALSLGWDEQERAIAWYDRIGQPYRVKHFDWIGWRGVFTEDPEGNTVELVAAGPGRAP